MAEFGYILGVALAPVFTMLVLVCQHSCKGKRLQTKKVDMLKFGLYQQYNIQMCYCIDFFKISSYCFTISFHLDNTSCRSAIHGRGLFCKRNIEAGEMVIEYAGIVIRSVLTDKREKYYDGKVCASSSLSF